MSDVGHEVLEFVCVEALHLLEFFVVSSGLTLRCEVVIVIDGAAHVWDLDFGEWLVVYVEGHGEVGEG